MIRQRPIVATATFASWHFLLNIDVNEMKNSRCIKSNLKSLVVTLVVTATIHFQVDSCFSFVVRSIPKKQSTYSEPKVLFISDATVPFGHSLHRLKTRQPNRYNVPKFGLTSTSCLMGMWSQNNEIEGSNRIKACIPYLLPLIDGDHFGKYIYERVPFMAAIDQVSIGPLADFGSSIPFLSLGLFIALTLGTRFNTSMSRNLRFSAQQAALIDVALLIPELIGSGFVEDPLPRYIAEPCCNFVWYAYMSIVVYCVVSNLRGKKPDQIPYLSNSADMMVGPF